MDLNLIRNLCEKRAGGMRKLASDIGMSEANLHRCVNNNKIQAADLENIARLLKVDVRLFFDNDVSELSNNTATANGASSIAAINSEVKIDKDNTTMLKERISFLEKLLTEKERLIKVYEKMEERK